MYLSRCIIQISCASFHCNILPLTFFFPPPSLSLSLSGSFLQQILIGVFGSLNASTPYLGGILGLIIIAWIKAAQSLSIQFAAKNEEMEKGEWPLADFEKKEQ